VDFSSGKIHSAVAASVYTISENAIAFGEVIAKGFSNVLGMELSAVCGIVQSKSEG
jgi:predicted house-cleaning NTP pyrophosphatase (Maf/HAM1 superfamily)